MNAIRNLLPTDWPAVKTIYESGIATGNATFETTAPSWESWDAEHLPHSRIVVEKDGAICGWAALSPVSSRCVYAGLAEVSVYVAEACRGMGIGHLLLEKLASESERQGLWTLQAGILAENKASLRLHEKSGFRVIGYREKLGQLNGVWRDVMLLERRSKTVGVTN